MSSTRAKHNLAASYHWCAQVAQQAKSNFPYTFYLLPTRKRRAMQVVYAYLRELDSVIDLPDSTNSSTILQQKQQVLAQWQADFEAAVAGQPAGNMLPALIDTIQRFEIPTELFRGVMQGMKMDLSAAEFNTWADLEFYCHRVAADVGLICLRIWGVQAQPAQQWGNACGIAFQMTNILRDVGEDSALGRLYLPLDELDMFGYTRADYLQQVVNGAYRDLIQLQVKRTQLLYKQTENLTQYLDTDGQRIFYAMFATYQQLFRQVSQNVATLYQHRQKVSRVRKLSYLFGAFLGLPSWRKTWGWQNNGVASCPPR